MIWSIWLYIRFMLGNSTIKYICDTQRLNIICLILYFDIFTIIRSLFPLQHICYYFNKPAPYRWTLTLPIVYIFTIHLSFLWLISHDYSQLLFYFITYFVNNTGKCFVFVIYQHRSKFIVLIIIVLLFCL